jgi:hypothetical protein
MLVDYFNIDLTEELGLDNLPNEKKQKLTKQMTDTVSARISNAFTSRLTDSQREELDQILEEDGDVVAFVKDKVPNAEMIVAEIIANFKKEAVELQEDIRQRVKAAQ